MNRIIDGYKQFFEFVNKEDFFNFGLKNIITIDEGLVSALWKELLNDIKNNSANLFIRSFGRNGRSNDKLKKLYMDIFGIEINFDPINNQKPGQLMEKYTMYKKNRNIFNYQVSHVFGNTKNVYCFNTPWNIVFIPKILDPLTGHEAKGEFKDEFMKLFQNYIFQKFNKEISEFNSIMEGIYPEIKVWVEENIDEKEKQYILKEFKKIEL